ncbi:hypothetical protein [Paraburkholderia tropica]|uniref:hypothetical protein n=1 Tax=Paraburkholderia tropica TaxID=92647 RepID=UPI0016219584|nr:hypothetical protein [Paraburkholderia tropica]MBB2981736.1 hypothetical protein [Paraburkholderia tropica]
MEMWASFDTEAMTTITGIYSCEQPDSIIEFQAVIQSSDARYATWYNALVAANCAPAGFPVPAATA